MACNPSGASSGGAAPGAAVPPAASQTPGQGASKDANGNVAEKPSDKIVRTQASGFELSSTLTKDIYRQVAYQEQEAYTDYEEYQDSEYKCHTEYDNHQECHTEQQCHTEGGGQQCSTHQECHTQGGGQQCSTHQECHTQGGGQQCTPQTICHQEGGGQQCHMEQECGTSATGQHICKDKQVCTSEPSHQECHTENNCHEVPGQQVCNPVQECHEVPGQQVCNPVQDCHEVPGQQVCHNQQICQNVQVPHDVCGYETVTKTRPVTKYRTVTKYRQEFDHQQTLSVAIQFPDEAVLGLNEQEVMIVAISGDESKPSVTLKAVQTIYAYKVASQQMNGQTLMVQLVMDTTPLANSASYSDAAKLTAWDLAGVAAQSALMFKDGAALNAVVRTQYNVIVQAKAASGALSMIGSGSIDRNDVKINKDGLAKIMLADDLKMSAQALAAIVNGAAIQVDVEVVRQSTKLNSGQPIVLKKSFLDKSRN